jgi:ATP-binding cassette subfamily B protein
LIDDGLIPRDVDVLIAAISALVGLIMLQAIANFGKEYLTSRVGAQVLNDLRRRMFHHLQGLSIDFFTRSRAGDLISRLSADLVYIETGLTMYVPLFTIIVLSVLISIVILLAADWRLALVSIAGLTLLAVVPKLMGRRVDAASYQRQQLVGDTAGFEQENVSGQPVVKAFGLEQRQSVDYERQIARVAQSTSLVGRLSGLYGAAIGGVGALMELITVAVGVYLVWIGQVTIGLFVLFLQQVSVIIHNVQVLHVVVHPLQNASGAMQRVREILSERTSVIDAPSAQELPSFEREIRFDDVTFSYTGEQVNLDRLSLTIPAGQSIAVVGGSGSGKSTLLNLVMRFYEPTSGCVTIDGHDLRHVSQASLRGQIAAVFQETYIFNASIRDNIRLGRLEATDDEVEAAARAAEIHDFVASLPEGYDTVVGERGGRLSGGQRQRIAIARAILRNPRILLLDEPTSALDSTTEAAVNATLSDVAKGRTVITVTHRLAATTGADRIYVFDTGRLVEQGTHQELLDRGGAYRRLWDRQHAVAIARDGGEPTLDTAQLETIPLLRKLDPALAATLTNRFSVEQHDADTTLFRPGDPSDKLYIIGRGEVEIVTTGPTGEERLLAVLRDGEHFGEVALRREQPQSATARTRAPTTLLVLEREQVARGAADLLALPDDQRRLATWLARHGEGTPSQAASALGLDEAAAAAALATLAEQGFARDIGVDGQARYAPRFAARRGSRLRANVWEALAQL